MMMETGRMQMQMEAEENGGNAEETMATKRKRVDMGRGVEEEEEEPGRKIAGGLGVSAVQAKRAGEAAAESKLPGKKQVRVTLAAQKGGSNGRHCQVEATARCRTFSSLPDEMKAKVFSYLDWGSLYRSTLVCKDWCRVATEWMGIRKKMTLDGRHFTLEESVVTITSNKTHLKAINLRHWDGEKADSLLKVVAESLPHLKHLHALDMFVPQNMLELIARECSELQDISLSSFNWYGDYWRHPLDILSFCRELEKITIRGKCFPPPSNKVTGQHCPKLTNVSLLTDTADREVEVLACTLGGQLRKLTVEYFSNPESFLLFAHFPQLEELEFQTCVFLTDAGLEDGIGRLHNLRSLTLLYPYYCTAQSLRRFFSNPNIVCSLEKLSLSCCSLDDSCISAIAANCPLLTHFCLMRNNRVTNAPLLDLVRRCRNLQRLVLNSCSKLDLGAEALGQFRAASTTLQISASP